MRAHEFILNEKRRKKRKARSVTGPYYGYYYGLGTTTDSGAEGGDGGGMEEGELIPWPKGTVKVDVSDVYDWYKLGQHISNLKGLGKHDFGKGPPQTVMAFGSEPLEHEYIKDLNKIGLKTYDIDEDVTEGKMAELDMDLEDPEITDRQFEKIYGMTRKEARELFSRTNMWDFPDFRDPSKPLHEQGVTKDSVIFLNDNTVIVGQEHGKSLELSPETSKQVRAIAKKYGAWYEGNGMDKKFTKGIIDEYQGSWDDDLLSPSIKGYPYPFLYVLFSNIEANDTVKGKIGSDPKVTIFNRILDTQPSTNYFPDRTFSSGDLTKFLKSVSQGPYDFVKMSQAPATEKNVQKFFKIGEKLMWPENWEEYPNNAGQLAKRVNDLRDKFLASRKSGVYVVGSSHLIAVKNFANKQDVSESLDRPYSYHWEEGDFGDLNAYAKLSDNTVLDIEFEQINVDKSQWTVGFQRDGQIHKTGKGDEQRVFATVLSAIKEFIENKQPKEVFFSAEKSEVNPESRKRLYDRLVQKYATALGYQAAQSETSRETKYKLSRIREQGVAEGTDYEREPLYHATLKAFEPSIMKSGLLPGGNLRMFDWSDGKYVYLSNYPDIARDFIDPGVIEPNKEHEEQILELMKQGGVILKIDQNKLNRNLLTADPHFSTDADDGAETYIYSGVIPPSAIIGKEYFSITESTSGVAKNNLTEFAPSPDFRDEDDRQDMPLLEFAEIIKLFLGSEYTMIDRKTPEQVSVKFDPKDKTSGHNGAVLYSIIGKKQNEYPTVNFQLIDYEQGTQVGRGRRAGTAILKTRANALKIADIIYNTMGLPKQDRQVEENFPDGKHTAGNYRLQEAGPLKIAGQVAAAHSSANDVVSRFQRGDYAGAGIGALSAIANLKPGLGTAVSLGLDYINDQRDKQNSVANLNKPEVQSGTANDEIKPINPDAAMQENFADGRNPGRKGLAKRMGVPTKASVTRLRQIAKSSSGEKQRMAHWMANMKAGKKK